MENNAEQLLENGIAQLQGKEAESEEPIETTEPEKEAPKEIEKEPDGSGFVKTEDKAADARIRYLARQVRASDEKNAQKDVLIDTLGERLAALENSHKSKSDSEAINIVKSQLKEAKEAGDIDREIELTDRLTDLKAELKLNPPKQKETVTEKKELFSPADVAYVEELIPSRPYLEKGHKDFQKALGIAARIAKTYDDQGKYADIVTIMDETHKALNPPVTRVPEVLPGRDLTTGRTNGKIRLDEKQVQLAKKLGIPEDSLRAAHKIKSSRVSIDSL